MFITVFVYQIQNRLFYGFFRFSCHRNTPTSDGFYGVITYTDCDINEFNIMSPSTGKATITRDGEYFITFYADLVSEYGWAYCTLFLKSGATLLELGSINNDLHTSLKRL